MTSTTETPAEQPNVIMLRQFMLGLNPFLIIELTGMSGDEDIKTELTFGGGMDSESALEVIATIAEQQPPAVVRADDGTEDSAYDRMVRAFQIFQHYDDGRGDIHAEHDELWAGGNPGAMSAEHLAELDHLGWMPDFENETFHRFC
jgi:hypothetical protein